MVAILISRPLAAAFVRPVDPALVPGYADVVSKPMDLVRYNKHCTKGGRESHAAFFYRTWRLCHEVSVFWEATWRRRWIRHAIA